MTAPRRLSRREAISDSMIASVGRGMRWRKPPLTRCYHALKCRVPRHSSRDTGYPPQRVMPKLAPALSPP
jgi:hypothetical protein